MSHESIQSSPYESMTFEQMEADPVAGPVLQTHALEYLLADDKEYFDTIFSGELDSDGYLLKKDGTNSHRKPSQNISGPALTGILERTREALAKM